MLISRGTQVTLETFEGMIMDARGVFAACVLAGMGKGSMPSQYDIQNQVEALEDFVEYCDEKRFITAEQIARDFQWSLEKYLSEDEGDE